MVNWDCGGFTPDALRPGRLGAAVFEAAPDELAKRFVRWRSPSDDSAVEADDDAGPVPHDHAAGPTNDAAEKNRGEHVAEIKGSPADRQMHSRVEKEAQARKPDGTGERRPGIPGRPEPARS